MLCAVNSVWGKALFTAVVWQPEFRDDPADSLEELV